MEHRTDHRQASLLPTGQAQGVTLLQAFKANRSEQPQGLELQLFLGLSQRQRCDGQAGQHRVPHHEALSKLGYPARPGGQLPGGETCRIIAVPDPDLTRDHGQRSQENGEQGGFSRSAVSLQRHQLTCPELHINSVEHSHRGVALHAPQGERRGPVGNDSLGTRHSLSMATRPVRSEKDLSGLRVGRTWDPEPELKQVAVVTLQHLLQRSVGNDPPRIDHDQAFHDPRPACDVVIGDDQGRPDASADVIHRGAELAS